MSNNLAIQQNAQEVFIGGVQYYLLNWNTADWFNVQTIQQLIQIGTPQNPSAATPVFPDPLTALAYYQTAMCNSLLAQVNAMSAVSNFFSTFSVGTIDPAIVPDVEAAAIQSPLTGLGTVSPANISAADTVLTALEKLQAQITALQTAAQPSVTNITPSLVGTGATGTQVSATKGSLIILNLNESVTSNIGGPATAAINIKICATNSSTEGNWTQLFTFEEDQTITLALALNSVQVMKGGGMFYVPAGYFWKAESAGSGTNSEGIISGQQIVFG